MPERKKPRVQVRFTAADGSVWTVYDVTWSNKKHHPRPHGDPTATERVFVNAEGVKRAYKFKPSDSHVLEEQSLERQLRAAAFLPTTKEDKDAYSLSEAERRTPTFHTIDVKQPARRAPPGGPTPPFRGLPGRK
jgi:hypothetical protein